MRAAIVRCINTINHNSRSESASPSVFSREYRTQKHRSVFAHFIYRHPTERRITLPNPLEQSMTKKFTCTN